MKPVLISLYCFKFVLVLTGPDLQKTKLMGPKITCLFLIPYAIALCNRVKRQLLQTGPSLVRWDSENLPSRIASRTGSVLISASFRTRSRPFTMSLKILWSCWYSKRWKPRPEEEHIFSFFQEPVKVQSCGVFFLVFPVSYSCHTAKHFFSFFLGRRRPN